MDEAPAFRLLDWRAPKFLLVGMGNGLQMVTPSASVVARMPKVFVNSFTPHSVFFAFALVYPRVVCFAYATPPSTRGKRYRLTMNVLQVDALSTHLPCYATDSRTLPIPLIFGTTYVPATRPSQEHASRPSCAHTTTMLRGRQLRP